MRILLYLKFQELLEHTILFWDEHECTRRHQIQVFDPNLFLIYFRQNQ